MKYFDPTRERYSREESRSGEGKLYDSHGHAIGVLPSIIVVPEEDADGAVVWSLRVFLPTRRNSFLDRYARVSADGLPGLLERWLQDPEEVLRTDFRYDYLATDEGPRAAKMPGRPTKPPAAAFSLKDLGLSEG